MRLLKVSDAAPTQSNRVIYDHFWIFDLSDLVSRQLLINISHSIVSLLPGKNDPFEYALAQRLLTQNEMRMLLPLLDSPTCCQQAVLLVSLSCTYELLLQSLLSSDARVRAEWDQLVVVHRDRLTRAHEENSQRMEMRGVYNALYALRKTMEQFGLTIRSKRDGFYLFLLEEKNEEQ